MTSKELLTEIKQLKNDQEKADYVHSYIQKLEKEFEEFSDILEDKVYKFVDDFLKESIDIPKEMKKYVAIGKRYSDFIDMFKSRVYFDECLIDEKAAEMLLMAKAEIKKLRGVILGIQAETQEFRADMKNMTREIYCHEQIEKLPIAVQKRAKQLCENLSSKYKIDEILRGLRRDEKQKLQG